MINDIKECKTVIEYITKRETSKKMRFEDFSSGSRYPYTYAYDFVRTFYKDFGFTEMPSRGTVATSITTKDKEKIATILAIAYYEVLI